MRPPWCLVPDVGGKLSTDGEGTRGFISCRNPGRGISPPRQISEENGFNGREMTTDFCFNVSIIVYKQ